MQIIQAYYVLSANINIHWTLDNWMEYVKSIDGPISEDICESKRGTRI